MSNREQMVGGTNQISPQDFLHFFEVSPSPCLVLTAPDWRIAAVSDAYLSATMTQRNAILGRQLFDVFPDNPEDLGATGTRNLETSLRTVCETRRLHTMAIQKYDIRKPQSEGGAFEERYWSPINIPVLDDHGHVSHIIHHVEDVTAVRRLEAAEQTQEAVTRNLHEHAAEKLAEHLARAKDLQESNRQLSTANAFIDRILENIPDMIFVKDAKNLRFTRINRAGERLLGIPRARLLGKSDFDLFPHEQAEFFTRKDREVLASGTLVDIEEEPVESDRGRRWLHTKKMPILDADGKPKALLGISEDITERKELADRLRDANTQLAAHVEQRTAELVAANARLEEEILERQRTAEALHRAQIQLRQAQKLEAIGRLAGGIAHDFNNLLSVILSYCSIVIDELAPGEPVRDDLLEVMQAGERAADLTRQLLAFSRKQVLAPKVLDLNTVLTSMEAMLRRVLGEDVELRIIRGENLYKTKVDPGQMEQVIMNLAVNARDAMPDGGTLTIETSNVTLEPTHANRHLGATAGRHVLVAVTDTGVGMDKETQTRIYEPFFTTKERAKSTGLGLATVFGIVQQSGGFIWHYSEMGRGTTFKLYFPQTSDALDVMDSDDAGDGENSAVPSGTETIVLVEDEDQLRVLASEILRRLGYQVLDAKNGWEALLLCERHNGPIDILVTDVVMPKMSGRELSERFAKLRPDAKILFMSGYTDDTVVRHGIVDEGVQFLQKPITPNRLARKVREVLDRK